MKNCENYYSEIHAFLIDGKKLQIELISSKLIIKKK